MKKRTKSTKAILSKKRTTISLSPDLLEKGEVRAREARRNFSNYIEVLIEADLANALNGEIKMPATVTEVEVPA